MNAALLAVDDGLTNSNFNAADIFFLIGAALAVFGGLMYAAGNVPVVEGSPPRYSARWTPWATAFVAFAVASVAFGLFLL